MAIKFTKYHGLSAQRFLDALEADESFDLSPPIDVEKILNLLDVKLSEDVDFDDISTVGSVSIRDDHARVWVNPIENNFEPRRRFTIAHEIGHLILHIDPEVGVKEFIDTKKTLNRKESYWNSKEYEANNFAAQLLMPLKLIKTYGIEEINKYKESTDSSGIPVNVFIERMAKLFNVSEPAMKFRLKNAKVIK